MKALEPVAEVMKRQMPFMDAPAHTRLRGLCLQAFTSRQVDQLRPHIEDIPDNLIVRVAAAGRLDDIADFAAPLAAIVTAELLGLPTSDPPQLKAWSAQFAELLGNFQHNPDRVAGVTSSLDEMVRYFRAAMREQARAPRHGLIWLLMEACQNGSRLSDDEIIANVIVTMVGGQETTTNLIGNGLLTLLRTPSALAQLRDDPSIIEPAVGELLRCQSPSHHTARLVPADLELGGMHIRKRDAVIAVMAAANRDPARFAEPDRLELTRPNNRHVAFGWAAHFCFGAPLARIAGQIAFATLLKRLRGLALEPGPLQWRQNLGLPRLLSLPVSFDRPVP